MDLYYIKATNNNSNDLYLAIDNRGVGMDNYYWISEDWFERSPFIEFLVLDTKENIIPIQEQVAREKIAYSLALEQGKIKVNTSDTELLDNYPIFSNEEGKFIHDMVDRTIEIRKVEL